MKRHKREIIEFGTDSKLSESAVSYKIVHTEELKELTANRCALIISDWHRGDTIQEIGSGRAEPFPYDILDREAILSRYDLLTFVFYGMNGKLQKIIVGTWEKIADHIPGTTGNEPSLSRNHGKNR